MMLEGAGFEVIDLGINNPVENYLAALEEHEPDILGMSALLTTTMPYMKVVIDDAEGEGHPRRLHRARRRRAAERGVRQGGRRRRVLPRRRRRRRDRPGARPGPPCSSRLLEPDEERVFEAERPRGARPRVRRDRARGARGRSGLNGWHERHVRCLPAKLHSRPELIAPAVDAKLRELAGALRARSSSRTPTAAPAARSTRCSTDTASSGCPAPTATASSPGTTRGTAMHDDEPATFYLTDFLARHFDALVIRGLGLDRHPELLPQYFGNYTRLALPRADRRRRPAGAGRARPPTASASPSRSGAPATASSSPRCTRFVEASPVPELTVIWWRDIPAQVIAKEGPRVVPRRSCSEPLPGGDRRRRDAGGPDRNRRVPRRVAPRGP